MKQLVCEMCGSNDLMKQDGAFVCQHCGTKYSVEEAKKLMVEGVVQVSGTVKVDDGEELKKLYQAARNARKTSDDATALRHYEAISAKDPDSWEALFYLAVLKTKSIKNGEIANAAISVSSCLDRVFELMKERTTDSDLLKENVEEVVNQCELTAMELVYASESFLKLMKKGNGAMALAGIGGLITGMSSSMNADVEATNRTACIVLILQKCGDSIEKYFGLTEERFKELALKCWESMLFIHYNIRLAFVGDNNTLKYYVNKIKTLKPGYKTPYEIKMEAKKNKGCYIATAVYGSYDCPEVWTLRRYRDYTLAKTWYGRLFIKIYYAVSPTLVKWFGKTEWFKKLWQGKLDCMVAKLQANGVESAPYNDNE